jgi:hypothetical protein
MHSTSACRRSRTCRPHVQDSSGDYLNPPTLLRTMPRPALLPGEQHAPEAVCAKFVDGPPAAADGNIPHEPDTKEMGQIVFISLLAGRSTSADVDSRSARLEQR